MKKHTLFILLLLALLCLPACSPNSEEESSMPSIAIQVGDQTFTATLQDNATAHALLEQLPMTVTMSELNGNEKYCYLDQSLPTQSVRPKDIHTGDLMLFGSDCLVLFYQDFSSGYSYTPLGQVNDPAGLSAALGRGNVQVSFRLA